MLNNFEEDINRQMESMGIIQQGGGKLKIFKSPQKKYIDFKTTKRPFSPSPKRHNYEKIALTKPNNHSICTFILKETGKRCKMLLGIYPRFCQLHTLLIQNLYIKKSNINGAGNGLFSGNYGFKKGMIIGEYSEDYMEVKENRVRIRNGKNKSSNDSYLLCSLGKGKDVMCWDALDIRSTITRNANDAHNSKFKNNAYFQQTKDNKGKIHIYMVASENILADNEILVEYSDSYWYK